MRLPARCLARQADEAGVIGQALALAAAGLGHRPIAESRAVIPASAEAKPHRTHLRRTAHPAASLRTGPARRDLAHVLQRSQWRRRHQHQAAACHRHWNEVTAAVKAMTPSHKITIDSCRG